MPCNENIASYNEHNCELRQHVCQETDLSLLSTRDIIFNSPELVQVNFRHLAEALKQHIIRQQPC